MNWIRQVNCLFTYDVINSDVHFKMFQYNPKANYQPNGGQYLQILSGKDLHKQTIVISVRENDTFSSDDTFPASILNIFVDYPLREIDKIS